MTDTPSPLADFLQQAQWGPRQLVTAINTRLSSQGRDRLRLDPTAGYSWTRRGFRPRPPIPHIAAAVLTERLGFTISAEQLWPGRNGGAASVISAVAGLDNANHLDDLIRELGGLTTAAAPPQSPITEVSGADLNAAVLDQLHGAVLIACHRADNDRIMPEQVNLISAHVAALRRLDDRHGGGVLSLRYVAAELRGVIEMVSSANYDVPNGRRLLALVADLAQLLGWLHFDSSRYGSAERYLLLSIGVCRALGASDRAANAIGMLSYVSTFAGHGHEAVRLAEAAAAECRTGDPVLRARLLGREATAAAADGDLRRFRRRSEQAAELLSQNRPQENSSFLYYLSPAQLAAETGQGLVSLAEHTTNNNRDRLLTEAINLLTDAVGDLVSSGPAGRPAYARSGLLHGTFLARAHLLHGNASEAVTVMRSSVGLLPLVQSPRARHYLRRLRPALVRRTRSAAISEFLPEFDAALSEG